jgi:hypothetical protein
LLITIIAFAPETRTTMILVFMKADILADNIDDVLVEENVKLLQKLNANNRPRA